MRISRLPAGFIIAAQPVRASTAPSGADWVHEIKLSVGFIDYDYVAFSFGSDRVRAFRSDCLWCEAECGHS
jgi:hypothetical protein